MPGLKASRMPPSPLVRMPVFGSTRISLMPAGTRNGVAGLSFSATVMKSRKIGAAYWPAVAEVPSDFGLSKPKDLALATGIVLIAFGAAQILIHLKWPEYMEDPNTKAQKIQNTMSYNA